MRLVWPLTFKIQQYACNCFCLMSILIYSSPERGIIKPYFFAKVRNHNTFKAYIRINKINENSVTTVNWRQSYILQHKLDAASTISLDIHVHKCMFLWKSRVQARIKTNLLRHELTKDKVRETYINSALSTVWSKHMSRHVPG